MNPTLFDRSLQAKPAYYGVIDPEKFISENMLEYLESNRSLARYGTPVIDGETDSIWSKAPALQLSRYQMAWQGATGTARVLWDEKNLYVLIYVNDPELDKANANPWEQDSVEAFVDENNQKPRSTRRMTASTGSISRTRPHSTPRVSVKGSNPPSGSRNRVTWSR